MKVITVRDTPPYGHAPTYQLSLTYLERQKCYGPDKKILFKKQLLDLEVKGQDPMKTITVHDTPPYGHAPTYQISLTHLERGDIIMSLIRNILVVWDPHNIYSINILEKVQIEAIRIIYRVGLN